MEQATNTNTTETKSKSVNWRTLERDKESGVTKHEVFRVAVDRLKVRSGFNPRVLDKESTQTKIRAIADAYKAGRYVKALDVRLVDGEVEIVDGDCRYNALKLANSELKAEGKPTIDEVVCVPFKGDELAAIVHTYVGNEGEKLTPMEQAEVVRRLQAKPYNMQRQSISEALGCTIGWVDRLIVINKMPEELRQMVKDSVVSMDVAIKAWKEHGDKAVAELTKVVQHVEESGEGTNGKAKVTAKHTSEPKEKEPKLDKSGMMAALILGQNMPKIKGVVFDEIKDRQKYPIEVPGVVLKAMLALKAKVDALDTGADELAAEKSKAKDDTKAKGKAKTKDDIKAKGKGKAKAKDGDDAWPFKPKSEIDAAAAAK